MKRCPECGYRVKAELKRCPLCDGRMVEEKTMTEKTLHTRSHEAEGGGCLLEDKPVKQAHKTVSKDGVSKGPWANDAFSPLRFVPVVIVILFTLLRSCS